MNIAERAVLQSLIDFAARNIRSAPDETKRAVADARKLMQEPASAQPNVEGLATAFIWLADELDLPDTDWRAGAETYLRTHVDPNVTATEHVGDPKPHLAIKSLASIDDADAEPEDNMIHVGGEVSSGTVNLDFDKPMICTELPPDDAKALGVALIFVATELPKATAAMQADREADNDGA